MHIDNALRSLARAQQAQREVEKLPVVPPEFGGVPYIADEDAE